MPVGGESYITSKATHFSLLMQNLGVLEESFADSDVLRLEREILLQLGRLGALKLFKTCLSRTLETSNFLNLSNIHLEQIGENTTGSKMDNNTSRTIVRTGKSEERKSRKRRLENHNRLSSQSLATDAIWQGLRKPSVSHMRRAVNSRSRRRALAKNEAEMSAGVKVVLMFCTYIFPKQKSDFFFFFTKVLTSSSLTYYRWLQSWSKSEQLWKRKLGVLPA